MNNFHDRGLWIRNPVRFFCLNANPDPVQKTSWIRIRFVLRGWIRIRVRSISGRIRIRILCFVHLQKSEATVEKPILTSFTTKHFNSYYFFLQQCRSLPSLRPCPFIVTLKVRHIFNIELNLQVSFRLFFLSIRVRRFSTRTSTCCSQPTSGDRSLGKPSSWTAGTALEKYCGTLNCINK